MGLGTTIAAPPIRRGTSRPFQRALENISTTSGGFKTFTLKISMVMVMVMVYGLWFMVMVFFHLVIRAFRLGPVVFWGDGLSLGYIRVGGPCQAPNLRLVVCHCCITITLVIRN